MLCLGVFNMDELRFIRKCADHDKDAWNEFLQRYSRLIYSYIYRVINNYSGISADNPADDIFQELISALFDDNSKKIRSFKGLNGCSFATWLRLVTINFTRTYAGKQRYMVELDDEKEGYCLKDRIIDRQILPDEAALYKEHSDNLKECVKLLDNDDRLFVQLYLSKGMTLEAVRQVFRVSRTAIDMRKARLLERLKVCFKNKGFL